MGRQGGRGRGGRGRGSGQGRGNYKGHGNTGTKGQVGACKELGGNIFDYGPKGSADLLRTSWDKLIQHAGTKYGQDICSELQNKTQLILSTPTHSQETLARHAQHEKIARQNQRLLLDALTKQLAQLNTAMELAEADPQATTKLEDISAAARIQTEINTSKFQMTTEVRMELTSDEKAAYDNEWKTYQQRKSRLEDHRGKVYNLLLGQCTQLLQDKLKQDTTWDAVSKAYDPLALYRLIEKTILAQTDDQYVFATVYDQQLALYGFHQGKLTSAQYYEKFNTKVDVGESIGVSHAHHPALLEYCADELYSGKTYDVLADKEKELVREASEERYLAYVFLKQSGPENNNLKKDLQDSFTTGDQRYPKNRQDTLHLLSKYSKATVHTPVESEGTAFSQIDGSYNKKYWKKKKCNGCGEFGHPKSHCPNEQEQASRKDSDDASVSSKKSIKKMKKDLKKMQKSVAMLTTKEESDLSDSDDDEVEENSHVQFAMLTVCEVIGEEESDDEESEYVESDDEEDDVDHLAFTTMSEEVEEMFNQKAGTEGKLDLTKVLLLDNESTTDIICNPDFTQDIWEVKQRLKLRGNGGVMHARKKCSIKDYWNEPWFSKRAIANIISLKNLIKQYRVTYDSWYLEFVVHRQCVGKEDMIFKMHENGLHYYDPAEQNQENPPSLSFVNTVEENLSMYTKRQIKEAEAARTLYKTLNYPSIKDFKWIVRSNQIKNCPVTCDHIDVAQKIWGKSIAALKGKTTRRKPIPVAPDTVKIPRELMKLHQDVYLTIDIFFVNQIPFFLTLSRKINYTTVSHLANRKSTSVFEAFKGIYSFYLQRGFRITIVGADNEFAPLSELICAMAHGGPKVNLASASEHVPEPERRIRVVKERTRAGRHSVPFTCMPVVMTIHLVFGTTQMLNYFPTSTGISSTLSPKTIMSGETLDFKKHLQLPFGTYVQVHEDDTPRNSMAQRTRGAIALGPSGNIQGGYKFMALDSGKKIVRRSWDVIPMPDVVIKRVNELGKGQPETLTFCDRHGNVIGDTEIPGVEFGDEIDDDEYYHPPAPQMLDPPVPQDANELPGVDTGANNAPNIDIIDDLAAPEAEPELLVNDAPAIPEAEVPIVAPAAPPAAEPVAPPEVAAAPAAPPEVAVEPERRYPTRNRKQESRYVPSMTGTKYSYAVTQLEEQNVVHPDAHMFMQHDFYQAEPDVVAAIMTQLSLKAGLKTWGDKALSAVKSEMKQLHFRETFLPKHWKELTHMQRQTVLESHMFLKEKRCGTIKGRTVAGGNKQRSYIQKEDASSPTVSTESVLLTAIIDAEEGRDVAVIDIPNAFIQTRIEDEDDMAIIKLRGVLVDILLEIAPGVYDDYVTVDKKGTKQLLVQCQNALYGTMVASLLYYRKFVATLKKEGFTLNPYDPCVANKIINGKQMTICFHVDDCKLSHVETDEVTKIIELLRRDYESIFEDGSGKMKISRGKVHIYLGMKFDFSVKGQVQISMLDYVEEIILAFEKADPNAKGTKTSAAPVNLFVVNEDSEKLSTERQVQFHNLVAKTLFATKRARPDTCTAIAFLTTRVQSPDVDDWSKLTHLMRYLRHTRELPLILSANGTGIMKWYVDASFAVHPNMRGHSGGGVTFGRGFPTVGSTKHKVNGRSSTECELLGVDDFMPMICWTRYFMEAQGYKIDDNILYQDNKSSILLEKNGKASSGRRTKHINIRYFFITDRVAQGEVSIVWCPTGDMIADYATKPLQGALFKRFRDLIMGVSPMTEPVVDAGEPKKKAAPKAQKKKTKKALPKKKGKNNTKKGDAT